MISLIATVKNEMSSLVEWYASLAAQQKQPDEIVIVDGGSTDGTWEWLQNKAQSDARLSVSQKKGNISIGRNEAIRLAQGDIVVVADAGCQYDSDWFSSITAPFQDGALFVTTAFAPLLTSGDPLRYYLIAAATVPHMPEFRNNWLASSRTVAFTRALWQTVGGYPEWLPICEDVLFDIRVAAATEQIAYVRKALVRWQPRQYISLYLKQVYQYTRGDGHAKLFLYRQLIRFGVYGGLVLFLYAAIWYTPYVLVLPAFAAALYMKKFYIRFFSYTKDLPLLRRCAGAILLPFVIGLGDGAKMFGWVVGVWQRWTGKIVIQT